MRSESFYSLLSKRCTRSSIGKYMIFIIGTHEKSVVI
nr:MAG TPA: hypothetical protein [Caudoviricetes sp.]